MLAAFGRLGMVAGIVAAFALGMAATVYLSLRSPEVTVPSVVGQHYLKAQEALEGARLNIRKRAKRYKDDARPDTVLDQSPRAGEVVKAGQTVAVTVADEQSGKNAPPEGEAAPQATPEPTPDNTRADENREPRANANNSNRNTNRNANRNANNRNANNRNANNANNANANNRNAGANTNRPNANNSNRNTNANRNANANSNRTNANRPNTNAARPGGNNANRNANRRPTPTP